MGKKKNIRTTKIKLSKLTSNAQSPQKELGNREAGINLF
jgi:hypothetical protein